jgi:uncharacterized protein
MRKLEGFEVNDTLATVDKTGFAQISGLLSNDECIDLQSIYTDDIYRSTINMERYRFGKGEYKYFNYPLPGIIQQLRTELYESLAPLANNWMRALGIETIYPLKHEEFLGQCKTARQLRPTPLILRYETGGYNTLHQDLYGEVYFPFQVVIVLTQPNVDHHGGELVFVEQLPRAQSKAEVISPGQGDAVIFTTNFRPVQGSRGYYQAKMKHGVSPIRSGSRMALGIIFHDAT